MNTPTVSVILVSFNTKHLLDRCLESIRISAGAVSHEIIVVDNGSKDGSAEHLKSRYPEVQLMVSPENLGFAGANNRGFPLAKGKYVVLLNTDAFLVGSCLADAVALMEARPEVGLAGAKLVGENREWQPSARTFPGLWNEFVTLTGLSARFPRSRLWGRPDMTWADQNGELFCHWVPGAFSIIRKEILDGIGFFDEAFFLYYEEVDLCRRIRQSGWKILYAPQLEVIHIGGASTSVFSSKLVTKSGMQMTLWRLQAQYLYHRKHGAPWTAFLSRTLERLLNQVRASRNAEKNPAKAEESRVLVDLIDRAWDQTKGGRVSPPRPWQGV